MDLYIDKCRYDISLLNFNTKHTRSNLASQERNALIQLRNRNDIVIKSVDEGGRIVIWSKDLYLQEGHSQLQTTSYRALDKNPTKSFNKTIINFVKEEINNENLPNNTSALYSQHPRTSVFYYYPRFTSPIILVVPLCPLFLSYLSNSSLPGLYLHFHRQRPTYLRQEFLPCSSHLQRIFIHRTAQVSFHYGCQVTIHVYSPQRWSASI